MRGFLTIVINSPDDIRLSLQDGGKPFTLKELLSATQAAQTTLIEMMMQLPEDPPAEEKLPGEEKKDGQQKTD